MTPIWKKKHFVSSTLRAVNNRVDPKVLPFFVLVVLSTLVGIGGNVCEATAAPAQATSPRLNSIVFPVLGPRLSSDFGNRVHPRVKAVRHHNGIDLAAPAGTPIRAMSGGVVVFADKYAGYGNLVVVHHEKGLTTHYGHCEKISVKTGQRIKPGTVLGTVGSTGSSTGPHLHLEVRLNGEPQDPLRDFPGLAEGFAGNP